MQHGMNPKDIAIVTPFRKQVNAIRYAFKYLDYTDAERPLVDTVERLQGQDVEMIVLSFSVTEPSYYQKVKSFLLNRNRLNVMISRAKTKVVILKSDIVDLDIVL
jgi:superfamily I DNA and/or RNA helicase